MTYADAVRQLVRWRFEDYFPPVTLLVFPDPSESEIRLLEVTDLVPETGEVYPIAFGATSQIPYRTVTVHVTRTEYDTIKAGDMDLPEGWNLRDAHEIRPERVHE